MAQVGIKDVQPKYSIIRGEIFIKEPRQSVPQTFTQTWVIKPGIKPQKIHTNKTSQNPTQRGKGPTISMGNNGQTIKQMGENDPK
jgi:hypothetical protein